jgi:hypothetical protein
MLLGKAMNMPALQDWITFIPVNQNISYPTEIKSK